MVTIISESIRLSSAFSVFVMFPIRISIKVVFFEIKFIMVFFLTSVHYMKNAGAVLEPGSIVAKLELDDPSKVTQVI